jgi:large subunit ribosomal protein L32
MALQKRRLSRSRTKNRRAQWMRRAGQTPLVGSCPQCGEPRIPHRVCMKCGHYRGEAVVEVAQDED